MASDFLIYFNATNWFVILFFASLTLAKPPNELDNNNNCLFLLFKIAQISSK